MKKIITFTLAIASSALVNAAIVFSDDFSESDGTALSGKLPDIGGVWLVSEGASGFAVNSGSLSTQGAGRNANSAFSSVLSAGETLTLQFDSVSNVGGDLFSSGAGGLAFGLIELEVGANRINVGDSAPSQSWAVESTGSSTAVSGNTIAVASLELEYIFDSGAWTLTSDTGINLSGTMAASIAFDSVTIRNANGGDLHIDNLSVDISTVPEPSSLALLGFCGLALMLRRKRSK